LAVKVVKVVPAASEADMADQAPLAVEGVQLLTPLAKLVAFMAEEAQVPELCPVLTSPVPLVRLVLLFLSGDEYDNPELLHG
jgi:hypothetical protein